MSVGAQLTRAVVDDAFLQTARALAHAMLLVDQLQDGLSGMVATDFAALPTGGSGSAYTTAESNVCVATRDEWGNSASSLLAVYRGTVVPASFVQTNYRPKVKNALGIFY
jgi:hypothetical protein